MESRAIKIVSKNNSELTMNVIPGHFATIHSHINYYIDITNLKCNHEKAQLIAEEFCSILCGDTVVDTIVCLDGTEIIAGFLAENLSNSGINQRQEIYILTPEFNNNGQMMFRDNIQKMVDGKNVLLLVASATTGKTIRNSIECIEYYNGKNCGICALFSAVDSVLDTKIHSIFTVDDIAGYATHSPRQCPACENKEKIDAIVNSFGYSKL